MTVWTGTTDFFSETGTEGGYWAMQDAEFLHTEDDLVDGKCPWGGTQPCPAMPEAWSGDYMPPRPLQHAKYEGLRILRSGDKLTIYRPDGESILWYGIIDLIEYDLFQEVALGGWWIHADQRGVPRDAWAKMFAMELPCRLERDE